MIRVNLDYQRSTRGHVGVITVRVIRIITIRVVRAITTSD
jgi:hypothetical protein